VPADAVAAGVDLPAAVAVRRDVVARSGTGPVRNNENINNTF
jgi:hypothetical protein